MRKYWLVFTNTRQRALIYRARIVTYAFTNTFTPLLMVVIWQQYYASGKTINGLPFSEIITYYFAVLLISLWSSHVHDNVKDDIKDGELSNFVIKPFSYYWFRLSWELGWEVVKSVMLILPILLFFAVFTGQIHLALSLPLLISFILAYLLSFCMSMLIGFSAFYISDTSGVTNGYNMLTELLTGKIFPLFFFPPFVQTITNYLPFKYLVSFPAQIATNKLSPSAISEGLLIQFAWLVVMYFLGQAIWRNGIKKFSAVGL